MKMRRRVLALGCVFSLLTGHASHAFAQKKYDPGASDTEIRIGNTTPYSGPASAYSGAAKIQLAYFRMINDQGGVNGRKINYLSLDDGYAPPKTVEAVRKLVEQDEVLAVFAVIGTPTNAAIHRYLNAKKVPHLFPNSGAHKWNDPKAYPWTVAFNPSNVAEGRVYARDILKRNPNAKIALFYQNDDFGRDYVKGFKEALGDNAAKMVVAEATYEASDPMVDSQITQLRASGADTIVHMTQLRHGSLALRKVFDLGWRPTQYMVQASSSIALGFAPIGLEKAVGITSMAFTRDPAEPGLEQDPEFRQYMAFMKKYAPDRDPLDSLHVNGYVFAQALVHVLKECGDNLTRENLIKQATNLKNVHLALLQPGVVLNTSANDYGAIQQMRLRRFDGKGWQYLGDAVDAR